MSDRTKRYVVGTLRIATILTLALVLVGMGWFVYVLAQPLPDPSPALASEIYDINNELITTIGAEKRMAVPIAEIPLNLQRAVVAIEDHRFFEHRGIDLRGIARAIKINLFTLSRRHGASTITQQLARNAYGLTQRKLFTRKVKEAIMAIKLEARYTKQEILELYLNTIYFGHGTYGVQAASLLYFSKPVSELTLAESALLAGVIKGPGYYSPKINPDLALERRDIVLDRMVEVGFLHEDSSTAAKQEPIPTVGEIAAAKNVEHFRNAVIHYIVNDLFADDTTIDGNEVLRSGGLKIYTTMDVTMQEAAERAVEAWDEVQITKQKIDVETGKNPQKNNLQIALVAIDPHSGEIRAIVGSRDLSNSTWIRAFAKRPAGSAFKPFLYVEAIESNRFTTANTFVSQPIEFWMKGQEEPYVPAEYVKERYFKEYTDKGELVGYKTLTFREAVAKSSNVAAITMNYQMTRPDPWSGPWSLDMIDAAHRMGIVSELDPVLSLPLGVSSVTPLEMASAYCPLANGGFSVEPFYIRKIVDRDGNMLVENRPRLTQAIDPRAAYIVTDMLKDVLKSGGTAAHLGRNLTRPAAGKTGTSEDKKDGWFVGYTPDIVCAVWTGDDKNIETIKSGGGTAGPAWAQFIKEGLTDLPSETDFARPEGIVEVTIDVTTGQVATSQCPKKYRHTDFFIAGTQPTNSCKKHPELFIPPMDKDNIDNWWDWIFGR